MEKMAIIKTLAAPGMGMLIQVQKQQLRKQFSPISEDDRISQNYVVIARSY
jgi:hypothetical protein